MRFFYRNTFSRKLDFSRAADESLVKNILTVAIWYPQYFLFHTTTEGGKKYCCMIGV